MAPLLADGGRGGDQVELPDPKTRELARSLATLGTYPPSLVEDPVPMPSILYRVRSAFEAARTDHGEAWR